MSDWQDGGNNGVGTYWYRELNDHDEDCYPGARDCECALDIVSAFEDTQTEPHQWYAWRGDYSRHDYTTPTGLHPSRDEAVAELTARGE